MNKENISNFISINRFADFIFIYKNYPYTVKVLTTLHQNPWRIMFHIPKYRFPDINGITRHLIKFSSEYVECPADWFTSTDKKFRISTILGLELYIRGAITLNNSNYEIDDHLNEALSVNRSKTDDTSYLKDIELQHLNKNKTEIGVFTVYLNKSKFSCVENLIKHKSPDCKISVIKNLEYYKESKFKLAKDYLVESIKNNQTYFSVPIEKL